MYTCRQVYMATCYLIKRHINTFEASHLLFAYVALLSLYAHIPFSAPVAVANMPFHSSPLKAYVCLSCSLLVHLPRGAFKIVQAKNVGCKQ